MDATDLKIIKCLQKDARMSLKKISEKCFVSAPTAAARIDHLQKNGVIRQLTATLNYPKLGYGIKAFVSLRLEPQDKAEFYPYIASFVNVAACDCVTGYFSQIITCYFKKTTELDDFINEIQRFGETQTQIVFSTSVLPRGINVDQS